MQLIRSFPSLRVVFPFVGGVVISAFALESITISTDALLPAFLVWSAVVLLIILLGVKSRHANVFSVLFFISVFCGGGLLMCSVSDHIYPNHFVHSPSDTTTYVMTVAGEPEIKPKSIKIEMEAADSNGESFGRVLLYLLDKDTAMPKLEFGDKLLVRTQLTKVTPTGNPNEFNYQRYMRFHRIYHQAFVNNGYWKVLTRKGWSWRQMFVDFRTTLLDVFNRSGLIGNELAVASVLVLGYKADLDKTLVEAYAGAGATHVLSVSGLHVGIMYVAFNWALGFLTVFPRGQQIRAGTNVVLMIGYAILTGLSPSVCRAVAMFSFVAGAKAIQRKVSIYNTLVSSAFGLILYDPLIVMQVGFQLSYIAVFGIVAIQPWLYRLYIPNSWLMDQIWKITCVSIAAQVTTFALGLLYFHQFPNLFFVSNLFVIPCATVVLFLGLGLFFAQIWTPFLAFVGFLMSWTIKIMNWLVEFVDKMPYAVAEGVDISIAETFLIYALVGSIAWLCIKREVRMVLPMLGFTSLLLITQTLEYQEQQNQQFLTVYNIRKQTAIALNEGTSVHFVAGDAVLTDEQSLLFHVKHHWWARGIKKEVSISLNDSLLNRPFVWNGKNLVILGKVPSDGKIAVPDSIDIAVIHSLNWNSIPMLAEELPKTVVISSSLGYRTKQELKRHLPAGSMLWDVAEQGAYTLYR